MSPTKLITIGPCREIYSEKLKGGKPRDLNGDRLMILLDKIIPFFNLYVKVFVEKFASLNQAIQI